MSKKYKLTPAPRPAKPAKPNPWDCKFIKCPTPIIIQDEKLDLMMDSIGVHNYHQAQAGCICIYCSSSFDIKMVEANTFIADYYTGYDFCPNCFAQGGVLRIADSNIHPAAMKEIRMMLIDIVATQRLKMKIPSAGSPGPI